MDERTEDPQAPSERRRAARALLQRPLTVKEHDPDLFRQVRRHEAELDRWFTQRLGYRLHVGADTARLYKTTYVPPDRPLRTGTGRAFHQLEYVLLALVLASTAAGPAVISLRDLVEQVRSAAADAEVPLGEQAVDRRALVSALKWMVDHGLAEELHDSVEAYAADEEADAVLKLRPERISLLPLPALVNAETVDELLASADRRSPVRQWMRCRLVEDPVLYRDDLDDAEWAELRRRLGEEERILAEMFGLVIEARAEGVAAIDPAGDLADQSFPTGGTVGHAALLLIEALRNRGEDRSEGESVDSVAGGPSSATPMAEVIGHLSRLAEANPRWSKDLRATPERLARQVVELLVALRLAASDIEATPGSPAGIRLLPAAARFLAVEPVVSTGSTDAEASVAEPGTLW